jgi:uncharacterized protein YjbJ (UPF0337 family)
LEVTMNRDIFSGNWKQLKGEILSRWGRLTNDEIDEAKGDFEKLVGLVQERYGLAKDEARKQLEELSETIGEPEPAGVGRP